MASSHSMTISYRSLVTYNYYHIIVCVPAKTPFSLTKAQSVLRSVIVLEQAVLKQISEEGKARVFITDAVLHDIDVHI
jgi:hypothetical protein